MKVTLYMAISLDGFIATSDGDSDWVSPVDSKEFEKQVAEAGCIVVGRRTFDQFRGELYPMAGVSNIVMTEKRQLTDENSDVVFTRSCQQALACAEQRGHDQVLLIGGGHVNGAFLQSRLIDEVIMSVHPLILGSGIKVFEAFEKQVDLRFVSSQQMEAGLIQLRYTVSK